VRNNRFAGKLSRYRKIGGDLLYAIGSTVVLNAVLNIAVYPLVNRFSGSDMMGNILYFIGIVYIIPQAAGSALGNARLIVRKTQNASNGDYSGILRVFCAGSALVCAALGLADCGDHVFAALFGLFAALYALRMYAQVEFRLNLRFLGYFLYNVIVSAGYLAGLGLYFLTGQWLLIFAVGEAAALLYSLFRGKIFRKEAGIAKRGQIYKTSVMFLWSVFVRDGMLQFDKVVIKQVLDPTAVTEYHVVSMIAKVVQMLVSPINLLLLSYLTADGASMTRRAFRKFVLYGLVCGAFFYGLCLAGTPIYLKIFYRDIYSQVMPYSLTVNLGLILGFLSNLYIVVLVSQGQTHLYTIIRTAWGAAYVVSAYALTAAYGIQGLIAATIAVNTLHLVAGLVFGYRAIDNGQLTIDN